MYSDINLQWIKVQRTPDIVELSEPTRYANNIIYASYSALTKHKISFKTMVKLLFSSVNK